MELFVGIDVSKAFNVGCGLLSNREVVLKKYHFANSLDGAEALRENLLSLVEKFPVDAVKLGVESTSFYHYHLAHYMVSLQERFPVPITVYCFNPSLIKAFKKTYPKRGKNDAYDAYVIAERVRHGSQLPHPFEVNDMYQPLQRLTRYRFHVVGSLIREKSYFLNMLFLKFNTFETTDLSNVFGQTSLAVLSEFHSPDEIVNTPLADLAAFLREKSRNKLEAPDDLAEQIQKVARNAYRLSPNMNDSLQCVLRMSMLNIQMLEKHIAQTDKIIAKSMQGIQTPLPSIPGFGPVITAGLVAEIGSVERFSDQAKLAKYAGLTWNEHQSGDFVGDETPLNRSGNAYLRYYFVQGAEQVRKRIPEYAQYYQKKHQEATTHAHRRALVLTARKLVRLVYTLMQTNQLYRPS